MKSKIIIKFFSVLIFLVALNFSAFSWVGSYAPLYTREGATAKSIDYNNLDKWINTKDLSTIVNHHAWELDLNQDGKLDYIFMEGSTGCGLMCLFNEITFIISSPKWYVITKIGNMGFEIEDIISYRGQNYFIMSALLYGNKRNYWHNRLFSFGKNGKLEFADHILFNYFPSYIHYKINDNHTQAAELDYSAKKKLWEDSRKQYWPY